MQLQRDNTYQTKRTSEPHIHATLDQIRPLPLLNQCIRH